MATWIRSLHGIGRHFMGVLSSEGDVDFRYPEKSGPKLINMVSGALRQGLETSKSLRCFDLHASLFEGDVSTSE